MGGHTLESFAGHNLGKKPLQNATCLPYPCSATSSASQKPLQDIRTKPLPPANGKILTHS